MQLTRQQNLLGFRVALQVGRQLRELRLLACLRTGRQPRSCSVLLHIHSLSGHSCGATSNIPVAGPFMGWAGPAHA